MADAYRDSNNVPTLIASSSTDGKTPVRVYADPTTHRLLISAGLSRVDTTWASTGNTDTVTDANCASTSFITIMNTQTPAGRWSVVPGSGSFVVTSSDSESAGLTYSYKIFP